MTGIFVLVIALFVITVLALGVVALVALPQRAVRERELPGAESIARRIETVASRAAPPEAPPAYGVLSSPERGRRAQRRIERVERKVVGWLRLQPEPSTVTPARHASGTAAWRS
jgi:hypothetical protein